VKEQLPQREEWRESVERESGAKVRSGSVERESRAKVRSGKVQQKCGAKVRSKSAERKCDAKVRRGRVERIHPLNQNANKVGNIPSICLMRASAVEADQAHNPEVVGSNPTPATKTKLRGAIMLPFNFGANNRKVNWLNSDQWRLI
jgi:hypothetical protein